MYAADGRAGPRRRLRAPESALVTSGHRTEVLCGGGAPAGLAAQRETGLVAEVPGEGELSAVQGAGQAPRWTRGLVRVRDAGEDGGDPHRTGRPHPQTSDDDARPAVSVRGPSGPLPAVRIRAVGTVRREDQLRRRVLVLRRSRRRTRLHPCGVHVARRLCRTPRPVSRSLPHGLALYRRRRGGRAPAGPYVRRARSDFRTQTHVPHQRVPPGPHADLDRQRHDLQRPPAHVQFGVRGRSRRAARPRPVPIARRSPRSAAER